MTNSQGTLLLILQILTIIQPEILVRWHRAGFRRYWYRWESATGRLLSALGNYTPERHESGILPRTFQAASASRLIGRPLMRLSRHYRLGRSQPTLDFVDTVVDTPVFISPKALACFSSSPQNLRQRIGSKCSLSALSLITACWSQRLRSASRVVQIDGRGSAI